MYLLKMRKYWMKIAVLTRSEHWLTFLDGSGTEYYITIAHVSVKAKSYIILASTCTWVCRQGQSCVGDLVRFMSLRTNSAKRPMNDTLCYQFFANTKQTWLISFFFNLVLNIFMRILSEIKEMHSWIGGIVNGGIMTCFLILWGYLNSRYRVHCLTFQCKYPCR